MKRAKPPQQQAQGHNSWMHLAAMNLIADHAAGKQVDATKLELAKRLLGQPYEPVLICADEVLS